MQKAKPRQSLLEQKLAEIERAGSGGQANDNKLQTAQSEISDLKNQLRAKNDEVDKI